ncbi:ROK family protein [Streptomyces sp. NPDC004542]|uniref:ROK family transcriptional regulator n=1 Tax=Streptomyces sp. NPDC004542 TaxID=3154281 RepID=UPI0033A66539
MALKNRVPLDAVALPVLRLPAGTRTILPQSELLLGQLAMLVASGTAQSKADIVSATGLPRSTVSGHVDALKESGVLETSGTRAVPGRGRPADRLVISSRAGAVVAIDMGATRTRIAVAELNQHIIAMEEMQLDVSIGPEPAIRRIREAVRHALRRAGRDQRLHCAVLGLPARVDSSSGIAVRPSVMPDWDGYPVVSELAEQLGTHVLAENDVNLRALGESAVLPADQLPLVSVKIAAGIGAGIVDNSGRIFRGFDGGAGDLGHIPVSGADDVLCSCGRRGCLQSVASLPAMARRIGIQAASPDTWDDAITALFERLSFHDPLAVDVVRVAAEGLGEVLVSVCNLLNPRRIVLGGGLIEYSDDLLAIVRGAVYSGARPLASRNLIIEHATLRERGGIAGALVLGIEHALETIVGPRRS